MIAFRDILIFAGLAALAAAVIASLFPVREGVSAVPACSDCAFKLTGGYWIRQYDNYAALYLGTREAARYGWAYVDGRPLSVGEIAGCNPMYVYVLDGVAYVSCSGISPTFGRRVLNPVEISVDLSRPGCTYTVDVAVSEGATVYLHVYDEGGRLVYSTSSPSPATFTFSLPVAGTYRMRIYAPPLLDQWYTLYARVSITASKAAVYTSNNTQDLRSSISLKIFDLTNYWKRGYASVTVQVNPAGGPSPFKTFKTPSPTTSSPGRTASLATRRTAIAMYIDEVWRLTFTPSGPILTRIHSSGGFWHEVYADGQLIYTWNKPGPKNDRYTGSDPTIAVRFVSPDSTMNAEATFTKVCRWS
jgi:hypothetical protein